VHGMLRIRSRREASERPGSLNHEGPRDVVMTPGHLQMGQAYYRITYADPALTIPSVKAMIYIGTNILPDGDTDVVKYYCGGTP
jgi:hypothetical protein